jgi:predicted Zn-dependent protease
MKFLSQEETKRISDKVLSLTKADQCEVTINGSRKGNIRYARNAVSTAGLIEDTQLVVSVAFGKKQGTATINEFDEKSLEKAVRRAEDLARLAPENPEFMPTPSKQSTRPPRPSSRRPPISILNSARRWRPTASRTARRTSWWQRASSPTAPRSPPSPTPTACSATSRTRAWTSP